LIWIYFQISSGDCHDSFTKHILQEIISLIKKHETNLSLDIKSALTKVVKNISRINLNLRHILELMIKGNVSEIENPLAITLESVAETKSEFLHLFQKYHNSRFIMRVLAKFQLEICSNHKESYKWIENLNCR
jgi:hypothetical protein